jgi:ABC-2 type transport system ATP-binding protein
VLGPNGAGKTTVLRMINDILAPDEGEIEILDGLVPGREAAQRIGYLPEERGVYPKMRVIDMLQFFGELRGLRGREAVRRADHWLERLELAKWRANKVQDLSKGMQQKVQFVSVILHEPELLILDEPWSGLDPINADVLREIVLELRSGGTTILFSTHLMEQAEKLCDQVCIIARGKRVLSGELVQIKRDAAADRMVAVGFDRAEDRAAAESGALADEALVSSTRERDGNLEIELAIGIEPSRLLSRLVGDGVAVERFVRVEPSLHQIFVNRVGAEGAAHETEEERRKHVG